MTSTKDYAALAAWQALNPPPPGMDREELERRLASTFPPALAATISDLVRPTITLWPQRPQGKLALASHLGGTPSVPPGWRWPISDGEPMLFLGQIHLPDLRGLPGAELLPDEGMLAFFSDHGAIRGYDAEVAAIFHWPETATLRSVKPPRKETPVFPVAALAFRPTLDLPDPHSGIIEGAALSRDQLDGYWEIHDKLYFGDIPTELHGYCYFSKLLGWPHQVQNDLESMSDTDDPDGYRLLLQLDDYNNGEEGHGWGPGGSLYFLMTDEDLAARRFENCVFEMQCT
jgi:uncharacterized protein YwqG